MLVKALPKLLNKLDRKRLANHYIRRSTAVLFLCALWSNLKQISVGKTKSKSGAAVPVKDVHRISVHPVMKGFENVDTPLLACGSLVTVAELEQESETAHAVTCFMLRAKSSASLIYAFCRICVYGKDKVGCVSEDILVFVSGCEQRQIAFGISHLLPFELLKVFLQGYSQHIRVRVVDCESILFYHSHSLLW